MQIIEPYARMIDIHEREDGIKLLRKIEWCARISHASEDSQTPDSWKRFLTSVVLNHGDWSVTEHSSVTVDAVVDRGITHEWVRHRIGAYTQSSTRFINYVKKMSPSFICPFDGHDDPNVLDVWNAAISESELSYKKMVDSGVPPQLARSVFPNALASRLVVTYNLRNWRHFFLMRTTKETHPQMRQITIPLLVEFKEKIPLLYDDIEPEETQKENLKKPR